LNSGSRRRLLDLLPALVLSAAGMALFGISAGTLSASLGILAAALTFCRSPWTAAAVSILAVAAMCSEVTGRALLAFSAGLLMTVAGEGFPERACGLVAAALSAQEGSPVGVVPLLVAALACLPVRGRAVRIPLMAALAAAAIALFGMPGSDRQVEGILPERFGPAGEEWPGTMNLDLSSPRLLMRLPGISGTEIGVVVEGGGVLDSLPLGMIMTDCGAMPVMPGRDTLLVDGSGDFAEFILLRPFEPLEHPVIHVGPAYCLPGVLE